MNPCQKKEKPGKLKDPEKDKGKYDVWMEHKSNLYVLSVYLIEFHSYILKRIPMEYVSIL